LGIWRNIGKIVSLSGEIIIQEIEWYLYGIHKKKKHESHDSPSSELNNIHLSEEEESIERSKVMLHQYEYEQVEWSENPYPGVGSNYEPLSEEMK